MDPPSCIGTPSDCADAVHTRIPCAPRLARRPCAPSIQVLRQEPVRRKDRSGAIRPVGLEKAQVSFGFRRVTTE